MKTLCGNGPEQLDSELMQNLMQLAEEYGKAYQDLLSRQKEMLNSAAMKEYANTMFSVTAKMLENPENFIRQQTELGSAYLKIWGNVLAKSMGQETTPLYQPDLKDRRFRDPTWQDNFLFDFLKQSYLVTAQHVRDHVQKLEGYDEKTIRKFDFYIQQYLDALSPSNFPLTNPKVVKETLDSKGDNLLRGFRNMMDDLKDSKGFPQIKTTDTSAFRLGENIAATPGKVVYQNELIQLIQYNPIAKNTFEIPILIIPAWINKYYILDLSAENSLTRWLVEQGFTVFMISWVNPTKALQHKSFEDYMLEGPLEALHAIEKATGQKQVHAIGYCLGGTLLTCLLSYLETQKHKRIASATLLTTMVDFQHSGQLGDLIDEKLVSDIEQEMTQKGYFDGTEMGTMFSMLRANDMIWSFVIHNYLLGQMPFPFDILYWNADATRLPAKMHSFYLRNMYIKNALVKKGGISLNHLPIDVRQITTPLYMLSTREDHIAPWIATYSTVNLCKKALRRFVLSASGHVAGVVNPPAAKKYHYWINDALPESPESWLESATEHQGSWWTDWLEWAKPLSGKQIPAPKPGDGQLSSFENAPGGYVREKC